ncbi:hypothetical protein HOLleu_24200 [Holothuria leucospilota]|uniref:CCHC-type domain-containing protein n=1 Tax=Holothuria leucospilota TaxID=206669 RepID=A0A9Q1H3D8_HOLLE|nr:hypothetical protein HOLleu_24200 [Holothuria leucospilota]
MSTPENATPAPSLRQTDFLPARFSGNELNDDECLAHFLAFEDYLEAHKVNTGDPNNFSNVVNTFKRTLGGTARLWLEGKNFTNVSELKQSFLARFSKHQSYISHVQSFNNIRYVKNESADQHLSKIERAASKLGYGDSQIRDKLLTSLPQECRASILMSLPHDAPTKDIVTKAQCYFDLQSTTNTTPEVTFNIADNSTDSDGEIKSLISGMESLKTSVEEIQASLQTSSHPENNDPQSRPSRSPSRRSSPRPRPNRYRSPFRSPSLHRYNRSSSRSRTRNYSPRRHNSRSTNRSSSRSRDSKRIFICFYCNKPGHIQRNCLLRRAHIEQSMNFGNGYQQFPQQNFRPLSSLNTYPPPPNHSNNVNYSQNF